MKSRSSLASISIRRKEVGIALYLNKKSAGHHSVLQGKNLFHPSNIIGLVTPLLTAAKLINEPLDFKCSWSEYGAGVFVDV